jgi:hypothetical protein
MIRGEWHLDEEGIAYHPVRGDCRQLKWRDVEAVKWGDIIEFRSGRSVLILSLTCEPREQREEVREFLRGVLTAFDLHDEECPPFSVRRMGLCLLLALPIALLALAAAYFHSIYFAPDDALRPPVGVFWVFGPLIAWVAYWCVREEKGRWRPRREKAA